MPKPPADDNTIRLCTWNIWLNHGPWEARHGAILSTLRDLDPDVVALQEVFDPVDGSGSPIAEISDQLGMHLTMGPPPDGFEAPVRNALLSRWPLINTDSLLLASDIEHRYRSVVMATVDTPGGPVSVFTTHLEHRYDKGALREQQLGEIVDFIIERWPEKDAFPPVLLGDLNAVPDSDEIRRLTGKSAPYSEQVFLDAWTSAEPGDEGLTWDAKNPYLAERFPQWPNRRLDYILVGYPSEKPLGRVANIAVEGTEPVDGVMPSDHYALVADLYTR